MELILEFIRAGSWRRLARLRPVPLAMLLGIAASGGTPTLAHTNLVTCYGTTLEVRFPAGAGGPGLLWSLPDPGRWFLMPEPNGDLDGFPCLPEPVSASNVSGGFSDWPDRYELRPTLAAEGVALRSVVINQSWDISWLAPNEERLRRLVLDGGVARPDGMVRRERPGDRAGEGLWLLPEHYLSPLGLRIALSCDLVCEVKYRLGEDVSLRYQFVLGDREAVPDWVAVDRAVRTKVLSWIASEP